MYYKNELDDIISKFDTKEAEKLQLSLVTRLIDKLMEKGIEDESAEQLFADTKDSLQAFNDGDKSQKKIYQKTHNTLTEYIRKEHGLVAKGYYPATFMSIGMAIGVGIGVALMSSMGSAFLAVGIGMGLAVGVGIGAQKEKKALDEGHIY